MNFIRTKNGRLYSANRIISIGKPETRRGEGITEIEIEGCGTVECYTHAVSDFLRAPSCAFPAQPETFIIRLDEESPGGFWKTLVIGWGTGRDGKLYPITADGVNDDVDEVPFILTPDGRVAQAENCSWESVERFLADQTRAPLAAE